MDRFSRVFIYYHCKYKVNQYFHDNNVLCLSVLFQKQYLSKDPYTDLEVHFNGIKRQTIFKKSQLVACQILETFWFTN